MVRLAFGARPAWVAQNRFGRGVGWAEAARLCWPHTLLGIAVFAAFACAGWRAVLWALPFAGGLLMAIPFAVITADHRVGRWLQRHGIAAVPEEIAHDVTDTAAAPAFNPR
jgi:membrane glycosyltransferase